MRREIIGILCALVLALSLSLVPAVPALAAPVVASVTATAFGSDTTAHLVAMPATVNAGNLLIVLFTNDGGATVTTPSGWTSLASATRGTPAQVRLSVYYKIAVGTEGGTSVGFTTSSGEQAAAQVYRITDWHDITPPEISTVATGISTTPNPPSFNPAGWDVEDTLWLAVAGQDQGQQTGTTAYPASYAGGISTLSSSSTTASCRTLSARRGLAAASENPDTFTIPASEEWVAFTVAVRPPAATPPPITLRSVGSSPGADSTSCVITKPAGLAVGDLMIAQVVGTDPVSGNLGTFTAPAGWTSIRQDTMSSNLASALFWKIADASDVAASTFTFTATGATSNRGAITAWYGHNPINPINAHNGQTNAASTTVTSAGITPSVADCMILLFCGIYDNNTQSGYAIAIDDPLFMSEAYDLPSNLSFDLGLSLGYTTRSQTTATGDGTATSSGSDANIGQLVAIAPNRAPTDISLSPSSVAENQPSGTTVGTLSTTDPDAGDTFTYTLVSGEGDTDNGSFNILDSSLRTSASFDYETKNSYSIRVRSTDQGGLWVEKQFTITVTNVNEAPVADPQSGLSVDSCSTLTVTLSGNRP